MKLEGDQTLLRVYLRNTDKTGWFAPPAIEALAERAHREGLAGATVLRGIMGLDVNGHLLEQAAWWSIVDHAPVILEIVDEPRAIGKFLSTVADIVVEGLATLERGHVLRYRHNAPGSEPPARLAMPAPVTPLSTLPSPDEFPAMKLSEDGQLLRIFVGESDYWQGQPLYRAIVLKAKELGLAGATVLRGPMGFGANSRVHTTRFLELSTDLPIIVEIVDSAEKVQSLLPFLDESVTEGLITIEAVRVLRYRHNPDKVRQTPAGQGGE